MPDGCLIWLGAVDRKGYGHVGLPKSVVSYETGVNVVVCTHRVAYVRERGRVPYGLVIDHLCHVSGCLEVQHLETVPTGVNTRRASEVRHALCSVGHELDRVDHLGRRHCRTCSRNLAALNRAIRNAGHLRGQSLAFKVVMARFGADWVRDVLAADLDPVTLAEIGAMTSVWAPVCLESMMAWTERWLSTNAA
jgi:hypothetical protein